MRSLEFLRYIAENRVSARWRQTRCLVLTDHPGVLCNGRFSWTLVRRHPGLCRSAWRAVWPREQMYLGVAEWTGGDRWCGLLVRSV